MHKKHLKRGERLTDKESQPTTPSAILVFASFGHRLKDNQYLDEFRELALSAGVEVGALLEVHRARPDPKYLIGSGKASQIKAIAEQHSIDVTIINQDLSPSQTRNLEKLSTTRVVSYTSLILDIFAQRASSHEGKLQVELAQLEYLSTRLVRGWTHLERQKGGIGLRGPGEKQLETDRRLLRRRVASIKHKLERTKHQRAQRRRAREKNALPMIALVGYTNTGKSTLFNVLTAANVLSANQPFVTLDTVTRRLRLAEHTVLLSDTVGFIKDLPHELIEAFNATLLEVCAADLILCIEDAADAQRFEKYRHVQKILKEIGAAGIKQLRVLNKIDLCDDIDIGVEWGRGGTPIVRLCALQRRGIDLLCEVLTREMILPRSVYQVRLPAAANEIRAFLYDNKTILHDSYFPGEGWVLKLGLAHDDLRKLQQKARYCGYKLHLERLGNYRH